MIHVVIDEQGVIVNRIVLADSEDYVVPDGHSLFAETQLMDIGASYKDGIYTPLPPTPEPPAPPVHTISDRQFFQQLALEGIIAQDQALASNAAVIPPPLLAIIDAMPAEQQFAAKMLVSGATIFERSPPMTAAIGAAYGWNDAQIDDFFRTASTL